jgi:glyoxylase-like metal-dependent hydrolase (beta-lactamase superfamily II)
MHLKPFIITGFGIRLAHSGFGNHLYHQSQLLNARKIICCMLPVSEHVFQISLGPVNCFLIDDGPAGLVLVDTGYKGSTEKIFGAIEKGGRSPKAINRIILTHTHPDHAGSAAEIVAITGARVIAHPADAALAEEGVAGRLPHNVSPGIINRIIFYLFIKNIPNEIPRLRVDERVGDGAILPIAGGLHVVHSPGHSAGHIALYLPGDDLLIAGDICAHMMGLGLSTVYEDRILGIRSILKAAHFPFCKAVFGHGRPLLQDAAKKMREKFS